MNYKPPEEQIIRLEAIDLKQVNLETLDALIDEVQIMLQTKSYREYYLDRLIDLEEAINIAIMEYL